MDPIGMAAGKRQVSDEFDALKVDSERERQLDAIVAQARRMKPRRRVAATTKVAYLPDIGLNHSPLQPMSPPPAPMAPMSPPVPPGPSPAVTPMKQATPPVATAPALPDPANVTPPPPPMTPNLGGMSTGPMAPRPEPAAAPPMMPPGPMGAPAPSPTPAMPKAAPMTAMPGEPDAGSMPRSGTPAGPAGTTAPPAMPPAAPAAPPAMPPAPADPAAGKRFPGSPSSQMLYDIAGTLGGDNGRKLVDSLPQWAQQYGLPIGGGIASLLGMYLLSRFMGGGQQKMGEVAKLLHDMHGAEAWESAGGEAPKIKMSKTIMTTDPAAC